MRIDCPNCGQTNRLPDNATAGGAFICGKCKEKLPTAPSAKFSIGRLPWWLSLLTIPYVLVLLILTVMNLIGPERWWFTSFNLYMPQWVYALPAVPLFLLFLFGAWRWAWAPVALGLWALGPLMGLQWHPIPPVTPPGSVKIRVMTYNVKWGMRNGSELAAEIRRWNPDIIQMQDSTSVLKSDVGVALSGWNIRTSGQYIIASRLPLSEPERVEIGWPGSSHHATRVQVRVGDIDVALFNVHLLSPRFGLISVRRRDLDAMITNAEHRLHEADKLVGAIARERGPVILTGDLNAPNQSLVCRTFFAANLEDSFSAVGNGYGYTYGRFTKIQHSYVRIDHILFNNRFIALTSDVGTEEASDHAPVIADLALLPQKP